MFSYKHLEKIILLGFITTVLVLGSYSFYVSLDRYNNFVYGKFDLGNTNQMLYNSAHGKFMVLTDYFGNNIVRWGMSHVDPSILIFAPINLFYSDASFLLLAKSLVFVVSAFLAYIISRQEGLNIIEASLIGSILILMPLSGYMLVLTTFHSLLLAMPFLLFAYYLLQRLSSEKPIISHYFSTILLYLSISMVILSKEELGFIMFAIVPHLLRKFKKMRKHLIIIAVVSLFWSLFSLFYLIPLYSQERSDGLNNFVNYLGGIEESKFEHFTNENYFLYRYSELGDSYSEIAKNIILNPVKLFKILFNENNIKTLQELFFPVVFSIFLTPLLFVAVLPEILIQMLANDPTVFSISNHRLLVAIPIIILSITSVATFLKNLKPKYSYIYLFLLISTCLLTSYFYKNPLLFPFYEKFQRVISFSDKPVLADQTEPIEFHNSIRKECANFMISNLSPNEAVSVPQPLGAKTSNRSYNALFPAGLDVANEVIADIYDRKLIDFLGLDTSYNKLAVKKAVMDGLNLEYSCDRFFLLRRGISKFGLGSVEFIENPTPNNEVEAPFLEGSKFYGFRAKKLPDEYLEFEYVYSIGNVKDRPSLFAYTVVTNGQNDWTFVHLPSFYLNEIQNWPLSAVVKESFVLHIPDFVNSGVYDVYFGIGNRDNNEKNMKIGSVEL